MSEKPKGLPKDAHLGNLYITDDGDIVACVGVQILPNYKDVSLASVGDPESLMTFFKSRKKAMNHENDF